MRYAWLLVLAACSPSIAPGAYLCGPEETCPEDYACNGSDNKCVIASTAVPFACDVHDLHEPDDTADQGLVIPNLQCVSQPSVTNGCLAAADAQNWVKFATPSACTAVAVHANVIFPAAYEPLKLELWDLKANMALPSEVTCGAVGQGENGAMCISQTLQSDGSYGIKVEPAGGDDCGGNCNFNRYQLTVQLQTP
jgi:hypothetical protein